MVPREDALGDETPHLDMQINFDKARKLINELESKLNET